MNGVKCLLLLMLALLWSGCGELGQIGPSISHPQNIAPNDQPLVEDIDEDASSEEFDGLRDYAKHKFFVKGQEKALLMIAGGWNTCRNDGPLGSDIFVRGNSFLKREASDGVYYRILASCYGKSSGLRYFTSSQPDKVFTGEVQDILLAIHRELKPLQNPHLYMIGHSYGGWLAMNVAYRLGEYVKISGMATLDPISKVHCTPSHLASGYFRSVFSINPHPGCARAPADFNTAMTQRIRQNVGWWLNYYQNSSVYLHSGSISSAQNTFLNYSVDSVFDIFSPHTKLDDDNRAWNLFETRLSESWVSN